MIDCMYVFLSLFYAVTGMVYGYLIWRILEVVDKYARGFDT